MERVYFVVEVVLYERSSYMMACYVNLCARCERAIQELLRANTLWLSLYHSL